MRVLKTPPSLCIRIIRRHLWPSLAIKHNGRHQGNLRGGESVGERHVVSLPVWGIDERALVRSP